MGSLRMVVLALAMVAIALPSLAAMADHAADAEWLQPVLVESLSSVSDSAPVDRSLMESTAAVEAYVGVDTAAAHAALLAQTVTAEGKTEAQLLAEIEARAPSLWDSFKATFGKRYQNEASKFRTFTANLLRIARLNAQAALSSLPGRIRAVYSHLVENADMSEEEFRRMLGAKPDREQLRSFLELGSDLDAEADADDAADSEADADTEADLDAELDAEADAEAETEAEVGAAPTDCDWRSKSSAIRNQGECGSCWAHSAVATLETAYNMKNARKTPDLSVQSLLDCVPLRYGICGGGQPFTGLNWLMVNNGSVQESQNRYAGRATRCKTVADVLKKSPKGPYPKPKTVDWAIPQCFFGNCKFDEDELGRQLNQYGALSINIDASQLQFYRSGVVGPSSGCQSDALKINHAVNLEGLGTDKASGKRYWIVRNSWGTRWGESGRFRLEFGKNTCGVATWAVRVTV